MSDQQTWFRIKWQDKQLTKLYHLKKSTGNALTGELKNESK